MNVDIDGLQQLLFDLDTACSSVNSASECITVGDNMSGIKSNTTITSATTNAKSATEEISSSLEEILKKQGETLAILMGENLEDCSNWNGFGLNEVDIDTNGDGMYTYEEFVAAYNLDQEFFENSYNQNNQQLLFNLKLCFDDLRGDKFPNLIMNRLNTYFYCANRHRRYSDDFNYDSWNNMYQDYTAFGYIYSRENENNPNFNVSDIGSVCLNMSHEQINDYSNNYLNNYDYEGNGIPDLYWNNAETPMDKVNLIISYTGDENISYHSKDNRDNVETELVRLENVATNILEMGYFFDYDTYNSMYDPKYQEIAGPMLTSNRNELKQYAQMISDVDYLFNECVNDDGTLKSPDEVTPKIKGIIKTMREPNNNLTGNIKAYVNIPISSNVDKDKVWLETLIELGYIDPEVAKNIDLSDENNEYTIQYKNTYGSTRFLQALYNKDENGEENVLGFLSELYTNCGLSETEINELEYGNTQDILYSLDTLNLYDESLGDVYNLFGNWSNDYSAIRYNEQQSIFVNLRKMDTTIVTDEQLAEGMDSLGINEREMKLLGEDYVRGYALAYAEDPDGDLTIQLKNELLDLLKHNKAKNNAKNIISATNDATGTSLGALSVPVDWLIGTLSMPLVGGYYGGGNFFGGLWNLAFADGEVSQFELEQSYLNGYLNTDYSAFADFNQLDYEIMTSSDYVGIENLSETDKTKYANKNVPRYKVLYDLGQISEEEYNKYCLYHNTGIEDCEFYKQVDNLEFRGWTKGVYNVSSSVTQTGIPVAISWLTKNPKLGSLLQAGSVAGSSREQMMQSGETNDGLIWLYSLLKGGTAYFVENMGGLMSAHADDIPPSILKMVTDELGEELIQYPFDMALDVGFKQRDIPNPEEFKNEMKDTIFLTSVSTLILGCGSNSIQRNQQRTVKLNNGYTYTASYNEAMKFKNSDGTFDHDGFMKFLKENGRFKTDENTLLQTVNDKYGEGYATDIELTEDGFKYTKKDGTIVECDMFGIPKVVKANAENSDAIKQIIEGTAKKVNETIIEQEETEVIEEDGNENLNMYNDDILSVKSKQYMYELTPVRLVKENPEEYIIPDCLDACKTLWEKGIDTTQCSNYQDNTRWIEIDVSTLSEENREFLYNMCNSSVDGFEIGFLTHNPRICTGELGENAKLRLCNLANMLSLQDTKAYETTEEYLDGYKRTDGEYIFDQYGNVFRDYNPKYVDVMLIDALKSDGKINLYVESEDRVYYDEEALKWHLQFLEKKSQENAKKLGDFMERNAVQIAEKMNGVLGVTPLTTEQAFDAKNYKLTDEQKKILREQIARYMMRSDEKNKGNSLQTDTNGRFMLQKGDLLHISNIQHIEGISKLGILTGQAFGIGEEGETYYCADFYRAPYSELLESFTRNHQENYNASGGSRVFAKEEIFSDEIAFLIRPNEKNYELLSYDPYSHPEKDRENCQIARSFVNTKGLLDNGEYGKNGGYSSVLYGVPSSEISTIIIGNLWLIDDVDSAVNNHVKRHLAEDSTKDDSYEEFLNRRARRKLNLRSKKSGIQDYSVEKLINRIHELFPDANIVSVDGRIIYDANNDIYDMSEIN